MIFNLQSEQFIKKSISWVYSHILTCSVPLFLEAQSHSQLKHHFDSLQATKQTHNVALQQPKQQRHTPVMT